MTGVDPIIVQKPGEGRCKKAEEKKKREGQLLKQTSGPSHLGALDTLYCRRPRGLAGHGGGK